MMHDTFPDFAARERRLRIGAVSYLNSKPLIEDLAELARDAELILDVPSRLADDLSAGELDVALIPSVEVLRDADYEIVSDACVATRGPVLSVKLFSRVPVAQIRTLALDEGSRTSATLVRILLAERFGVRPTTELLPLGFATADTSADAVLLIGDRAMKPPCERFVATWDLGEEWTEWTGLRPGRLCWLWRHLPGWDCCAGTRGCPFWLRQFPAVRRDFWLTTFRWRACSWVMLAVCGSVSVLQRWQC